MRKLFYQAKEFLSDPRWTGINGVAATISAVAAIIAIIAAFPEGRNYLLSIFQALWSNFEFGRWFLLIIILIMVSVLSILQNFSFYRDLRDVNEKRIRLETFLAEANEEHALLKNIVVAAREEQIRINNLLTDATNEQTRFNRLIRRIVALHRNPIRIKEWKIYHYIESNGDGKTIESQIFYAEEGVAYFRKNTYGYTDSKDAVRSTDIRFMAYKSNSNEEDMELIFFEYVSDTRKDIAILLEPKPVVPGEDYHLKVEIWRKNLWKHLIQDGFDFAEFSVAWPVEKLEIGFFLPNNVKLISLQGFPNNIVKSNPEDITVDGKTGIGYKLQNVEPVLFTFNLSVVNTANISSTG